MTFFKNFIHNIPVNTKKVIIISVILIIAVSYGLFFYMQDNIETSMRNQLFDKQKALQTESTLALSRHIGSDLDSIMARLQMLANSDLLQEGNFSSNQTLQLLENTYAQISRVTPISRLLLLNEDNIAVFDVVSPEGTRESSKGTNFSFLGWVEQTKITKTPVFSSAYRGIGTNESRIAIAYPILNRYTGEYLGLVATPIPTVPFFRLMGIYMI
jgi:hypothetical protein